MCDRKDGAWGVFVKGRSKVNQIFQLIIQQQQKGVKNTPCLGFIILSIWAQTLR